MAGRPLTTPKVPAQNDLYTVLVIVAATGLLIGIIYLLLRSSELFGWPFGANGA